tara:strand:+ start:735 stop:1760 length:1026 start_codon:yes stop_codon:yes gene_type:complete
MKKEKLKDPLIYTQLSDEAVILEGFNDCIVGIGSLFPHVDMVLIYDVGKIINSLMKDGMDYEEAEEHYAHYIAGLYAGPGTPIMQSDVIVDECIQMEPLQTSIVGMKKEKHLQTMELFSGTGSFSQVALKRGHKIKTFDLADHADELVEGTHTQCDVLDRSVVYPDRVDMLWASPPCTTFSVASLGHHWGGGKKAYIPKTKECQIGLDILERTVQLVAKIKPRKWYIENPRGVMRKVIDALFDKHGITDYVRHTITYCKYRDSKGQYEKRMKPTDVWTNDKEWIPREKCKNYRYDSEGNIIDKHCHHESARRGAKTGTQGLKGARERSVIPSELFEEIFED